MGTKRKDRRAIRSKRLLGTALAELMQEKRYIDITVQDIIDRADVGRTTFYAHYQDKEDLLVKSLERALEMFIHHIDDEAQSGLSVVELFRHVQENLDLYKAMMWGRGVDILFERGQAVISQNIERHLENVPAKGQAPLVPIPVIANFVAGSFLTLLKWWVDHKLPYTPEQMEAMFQQLVMPGAQAALGGGEASPFYST